MGSHFTAVYDACVLYLYPARVLEVAANYRRSLKTPPKTVHEYLDTLLKQGLPQSVAVLRRWDIAL